MADALQAVPRILATEDNTKSGLGPSVDARFVLHSLFLDREGRHLAPMTTHQV